MEQYVQIFFVIGLILIGYIALFLRRKAKGSRLSYKLFLIAIGILLASILSVQGLFFEGTFSNALILILIIILSFELGVRVNKENLKFDKKILSKFFLLILINFVLVSLVSIFLMNLHPLEALIIALLICSVEYFLIDELREEGDVVNPLLIFLTFSLIYYFGLKGTELVNMLSFLQYIAIGLGIGLIIGIISTKLIRDKTINLMQEIGLIAMAIIAYTLAEIISGSGIFAVIVLGLIFGNSFIRQKQSMHGFSPFIYKSVEGLSYTLLGFTIPLLFQVPVFLNALLIFFIYSIVRFVINAMIYKGFSFQNILIFTFAPKGISFSILLAYLATIGFQATVTNTLFYILLLSILSSMVLEYYENNKIQHLEKAYEVLRKIRYGRKTRYKH